MPQVKTVKELAFNLIDIYYALFYTVGHEIDTVSKKEKILIYGDYDVDGTMAVVVLLTALRSLGARVDEHIPHRLDEGYGMQSSVLERAADEGYRVVLSVDTGSRWCVPGQMPGSKP